MVCRINPCGLVMQRKCLWIAFVTSLCLCILALHHLTYSDNTVTGVPSVINLRSHIFPPVTNSNEIILHKKSSVQHITTVLSKKPSVVQSNTNGNNINRGFILVNKYMEQQTGAAINMLTLTKWAKTVGASPVEPFVYDSTFCSIHYYGEVDHILRFRDYFDIDLWNRKSLDINAMPLVSYSTFLTQKPDSVIIVEITGKEITSKLAYIDDEIINELEATTRKNFSNFELKINNFIKQNNMKIVRRVHLSFTNHEAIHVNRFNKIIYGDFDPSSVVVWFSLWLGVGKGIRIKIVEEEFQRSQEVFGMLQTSQRIVNDSKEYARRILNSNFGDYVAVSFRSIKRAKFMYVKNLKDEQPEFFKSCIQRLQHTISLMNNTKRIFLALDLGRFGDNKAGKYLTKDMMHTIEHELFHILYKDTLRLEEWEQEFVNVAQGITDSGYIATVQRTLLENSKCLIMFGGDSNFQRILLTNYEQKFSNPCIREVCYVH